MTLSFQPGRWLLILAVTLIAPPLLAQSVVPPAPAASAASAPATQRVEITGTRAGDTEQRRQSTAAKIVIGREEIDKYGDATVGEVLRRLPGVTTPGAPGRGGPPRMRGLGNGYTQLLIDGERLPPGFSLESLTPEQVERIEILRAPTAETGARAIAGTINIITREGYKRRINDVRLGAGYENGEWSPSIAWTHNDSAGALTYNLSASAFENRRASSGRTDTTVENVADGSVTKAQTETTQTQELRRGLNLTSRLQWRLGDSGDLLMLMPSVFHADNSTGRGFVLGQSVGSTAPAYATAQSGTDGSYTAARLNTQWRTRLGGGAGPLLELNGGVGQSESANETLREAFAANGTALPLRTDTADAKERSLNLKLKLSSLLGGDAEGGGEHNLVSGAEFDTQRRNETRSTLQNGQSLLDSFGDNLQARSTRMAAYAQDEWAVNANWAAHAGLRWEGITTRGEAGDTAQSGSTPENRSSVWTPLLHAVWKPEPKSRDQVRFSLTRSYRSPTLGNLIARPTLTSKVGVDEPNSPTTPDRAGNPDLKPELATGIDVALERYLEGGGVLSANLFHRRISDLMRGVTALETVPWSTVQRYVTRQQNIGKASTQGIELEAKFRLDQVLEGAAPVDLRGNLSLYRSQVDAVPGPDNRLDGQAKASANLGADYRFRGLPLTLGGNLNWVPGYRTQLDQTQAVTVSRKNVFDAYALWTFNPTVALRLLASNLAPGDYTNTDALVANGERETARTLSASETNWQLRLELKL
jgi:outer membrane receptor for ferrienterochelin and colicins